MVIDLRSGRNSNERRLFFFRKSAESEPGYQALVEFMDDISRSQELAPQVPESLSANVDKRVPGVRAQSESHTLISLEEPHYYTSA